MTSQEDKPGSKYFQGICTGKYNYCLLYTSDAADERSSVDLGGRRIIKKKKNTTLHSLSHNNTQKYR